MIRQVDTASEELNSYDRPQKVVLTVLTAGATIYVGTQKYGLGLLVGGVQQGTPIKDTTGPATLDLVGDIYWKASANGVQVDVLESGAV